MVMSSHSFEYKYQLKWFPQLKLMSLDLLGRVVFDMLCYCNLNHQLGPLVSSALSIMTFSDSSFSLR